MKQLRQINSGISGEKPYACDCTSDGGWICYVEWQLDFEYTTHKKASWRSMQFYLFP